MYAYHNARGESPDLKGRGLQYLTTGEGAEWENFVPQGVVLIGRKISSRRVFDNPVSPTGGLSHASGRPALLKEITPHSLSSLTFNLCFISSDSKPIESCGIRWLRWQESGDGT